MKLHRLEIEGFGPFRERQVIDFDAFDDDGLFLISGRTGAGKSSILDAVCFALYGSIPRYSAGEKGLRSDYSELGEPTEVALEFSAVSGRYRVIRSPEYDRPKQRGEGTTTQKAQVELARMTDDGDWEGMGARGRDVDGEHLRHILQLSREQFLQVILLAQGGFARFLTARSAERLTVLRTLFGTERFEAYAQDLAARRKAVEAEVADGAAALDARLGDAEGVWAEAAHTRTVDEDAESPADAGEIIDEVPQTPTERLARLDDALPALATLRDEAAAAVEQAEARHRDAETALAAARRTREQQDELRRARENLDTLTTRDAALAADRERLSAAERAETLRATLLAAERADEAARQSDVAVDRATAAWNDARSAARGDAVDVELAAAPLRAEAARAAALAGELSAAARAEAGLADRAVAVSDAERRWHEANERISTIESEIAAVPGVIAQIDARMSEIAGRAASAEAAHEQVASHREALTAAVAAERAATDAAEAERAQVAGSEALTRAADEMTTLLRRRYAERAGELAEQLVDGEPCLVCGSTEHPQPALRAADAVTDDDLAAAEERKQRAADADRELAQIAATARRQATEAARVAGGRTVAEITAVIERATTEAQLADAARLEHGRLADERAATLAQQTAAQADLDASRDAHAALAEQVATERERYRRDVETIDAARGDHDSVDARLSVVSSLQRAAERCAAAHEQREARRAGADEAAASLGALVAASPFADATAVSAALLEESERDRLRAQLRRADEERDRLRGVLERLTAAGLPAEPVDPDPLAAASDEARRDWASAQERRASLTHRFAALERAVSAARAVADRTGDATERLEVIRRLADAVNGREPNTMKMSLETFVLAAELEEIVTAANLRLDDMSSGRYRLAHTDERAAHGAASGLGIEVVDAHTGRGRPATSLSGGETFLASLALALGLAEVVTARAGGVKLDTLFIDEGFGSLDSATLETAMRTLDQLRAGGRTVGVISHVEAMHHQIPSRLAVRVQVDGSSTVVQDRSDSLEG